MRLAGSVAIDYLGLKTKYMRTPGHLILTCLCCLTLFATSCSKEKSSKTYITEPSKKMSFKEDGVFHEINSFLGYIDPNDQTITVVGDNYVRNLFINIPRYTTPGTITLPDPVSNLTFSNDYLQTMYYAIDGTVNITFHNPNLKIIRGTFEATVVRSNPVDTIEITEGEFDTSYD